MRSHPTVVNSAAALLVGWDPLVYASASGARRVFADAVLEVAYERRAEEIAALVKALASAVGAEVATSVAKLLG